MKLSLRLIKSLFIKGPVLGWMNVIEAMRATKTKIPVNLKFVLEGMEESGSEGLDAAMHAEKDKFLKVNHLGKPNLTELDNFSNCCPRVFNPPPPPPDVPRDSL